MRARVFWLAFFRFAVLIFSLGTIACHIVNLVILGSRDWWPHYIPYILYIVGPGVSVICAAALNFTSMSSVKSIRGDRTMAIINLALMVSVIVYNTLKGGAMPWTNNADEPGAPSKTSPGFATYCSAYGNSKTVTRCWVSDGLWLGCVLVAAFWLLLLVYVFAQNTSDIYDEDEDFEGYDYKQDVPMVMNNEASTYHAASTPPQTTATTTAATAAAGYNAGVTGNTNGNADYSRYDSYYDYPPQSPYNAYQGYTNTNYGYGSNNGPGGGNYGGNDAAYMPAEQNPNQQYYSPHLKKDQPYSPHAY